MDSMEKGETRNNKVGKGFELCGMEPQIQQFPPSKYET